MFEKHKIIREVKLILKNSCLCNEKNLQCNLYHYSFFIWSISGYGFMICFDFHIPFAIILWAISLIEIIKDSVNCSLEYCGFERLITLTDYSFTYFLLKGK